MDYLLIQEIFTELDFVILYFIVRKKYLKISQYLSFFIDTNFVLFKVKIDIRDLKQTWLQPKVNANWNLLNLNT